MSNRYLLDTNIILLLIKRASFGEYFEETYRSQPKVFWGYSYATLGELDSLAKQNQWGARRMNELAQILSSMQIVPMAGQVLIEQYGNIDASAIVLGATLITTDRDFDHLSPDFLAIDQIQVSAFL